ncbi:MAG: DegT/DnrJ/EryC1/StrS family aminotransferase [Lachnospiraceae bacterium]|nr:DegT/DnrJ/EryC1/StrS family aminotransferase [Lachnospiraceae bacterium]
MEIYDRLDRQYQMFAKEYKEAAVRVLDSGWYVLGKELESFEREYAGYMDSRHCVGLNNGLDSLTLSLRAMGIGKGDEVIVPANTFIATVIGIVENGATPVFVEPDAYYNLDADRIEERITQKTRAIIVVHLYGQAANMQKIRDIADRRQLRLLEDCAQAHTASFDGRTVGTWGDVGCFSFYPTKNLGAFGDSGAIITDSDEIADRMRMIRNYGCSQKYHNEVRGVNSRLDEMQAALLRVKLGHLKELIKARRAVAGRYLEEIHNPAVLLPGVREGATHVWHLFVVRCQKRDRFQAYLQEKGIRTQIHYPIPPHLQKCYADLGHREGEFPITEQYAKEVLSLPLYNGMTDEEIQYVIDTVNAFR